MQSFKDKVVVVTGGNSGIGKSIAETFHAAGAKLALFGRDQLKLNAVAEELKDRVMAIQGDVCQLSDIDKLYKEVNKTYGKIDALIVNAGIAGNMKVDEVDEQHFDSIMNTNLKGAYFTVQKAVPFFKSECLNHSYFINGLSWRLARIIRLLSSKGCGEYVSAKLFSRSD